MAEAFEQIERIFREEYGRVVASLVRRFGDIDIAEEAAGNKGIDRIRREQQRNAKHQAALMITDPPPQAGGTPTPDEPTGVVEDDRLRLIFTCCHPALATEARVALTLRLLGGLTVAEIAQAFLVPQTTMAQRITRAKAKIKAAKIPYRIPDQDDLAERLTTVLAVVYLVFNEGYLASSAEAPIRDELTAEAIRLGRVLRTLLPENPEVTGLVALMLLTEARRSARVADGELVPLHEQDRGGWDRDLIAEGHDLVRECLRINRPGHYQLLAAINAVHTDTPTAADTDWGQIATLYDQLYAVSATPVVALNRAIALAELDGPAVALAEVDRLNLTTYHAWHATRADLLRRLGRSRDARAAYDAAIDTTDNSAERAYLTRRRGSMAVPSSSGPRAPA